MIEYTTQKGDRIQLIGVSSEYVGDVAGESEKRGRLLLHITFAEMPDSPERAARDAASGPLIYNGDGICNTNGVDLDPADRTWRDSAVEVIQMMSQEQRPPA
jgi:hypothetical protein